MTNFLIPSIVLFIIFYGFFKKVDLYTSFLDGVKEGLRMSMKIFPTIFTMVICIDVFLKSNILNYLFKLLTPILNFLSFPKEILPFALIRPISGSSSLVVMNHLFKEYGPDSFIGRVVSILQGSTDTTIYIISLYFSSIGIKKTRYALLAGIIADLSAIILSLFIAKWWF